MVGDLDRTLAGDEGVYVVFKDKGIRYTNGAPYGEFYIWQLESGDNDHLNMSAEICARALVNQPLHLVPDIDAAMTSRGTLTLGTIYYGRATPHMPQCVLDTVRRHAMAMINENKITVDETQASPGSSSDSHSSP